MGNWTTDKTTEYRHVRVVSDAKHFPAQGEGESYKPAATFITIVDGTKNGEDIFIDAKVVRGAERAKGLKKGQEVSVSGTVEFSLDRNGKLRGKIWDAKLSYGQAVREALKNAAAEEPEVEDNDEPADDGDAPAFE